jgi:hypothetical protein
VAAIVRELNGAHGPLRGFRARRDASTFSRAWTVDGTVDLRDLDPGLTDDQQLVANLTNRRLDATDIAQRIAASASGGLHVRARAELPGTADEVGAGTGDRAVLHATADTTDVGRIALVVVGAVVVLLAVVLLVVGERRSRRWRRARPRRIPSRAG